MKHHMRLARPVTDLARTRSMYCAGLDLCVLGSFEDHNGFDGVMLGRREWDCHFEFTFCRAHPIQPQSTPEDLVVLYIPVRAEWERACERALAAGFRSVASLNPYWDAHGRTFQDADTYRVVLQNAAWASAALA